MLRKSSGGSGFGMEASDGSIGSVCNLLLGDTNWALRRCVIDAESWLLGEKVLMTPSAVGLPEPDHRAPCVDLTRKQPADSAFIDAVAPVSRQLEGSVYVYYGLSL